MEHIVELTSNGLNNRVEFHIIGITASARSEELFTIACDEFVLLNKNGPNSNLGGITM